MAKRKAKKGPTRKRSSPAPARSATDRPFAGKKTDDRGCALSFLNEERGELDKLCERTDEERKDEYVQPDKEREAGGES